MGVLNWSRFVSNSGFFKGREQCFHSWLGLVAIYHLVLSLYFLSQLLPELSYNVTVLSENTCQPIVFKYPNITPWQAVEQYRLYLKRQYLVASCQDGKSPNFGCRVSSITAGPARNTAGQDVKRNQQVCYSNKQAREACRTGWLHFTNSRLVCYGICVHKRLVSTQNASFRCSTLTYITTGSVEIGFCCFVVKLRDLVHRYNF